MQKQEIKKQDKKEIKFPEGKYFYAVGRRKSAIAQVRVYNGRGKTIVNGIEAEKYFAAPLVEKMTEPLKQVSKEGEYDVYVKVIGGGTNGQSEAIRHGISRALSGEDKGVRTTLKKLGFLTRDSRVVERKKPGLKKARRAPQWAKR
ncbi:MAG: 30S ribosomal protein S9 [Patescibacteria group bacterium]